MQKTPLISVIIPTYNVEKYVERCLDSILGQDYENLEVIIIDDVSPDNTVEVCRKYAEKDSRVKVYPNETNCGPATNRNRGLEKANGDYILFADADDFYRRGILRDMVESAEETGADLVLCDYKCYYSPADDDGIYEAKHNKILTNEQAFERLFRFFDKSSLFCAVWAKLFRRDLIGDHRFTDGKRYGEDMEFIAPILNEAKCICDTCKIGYNYSQEGTSLLRSPFKPSKLAVLDEIAKWGGIAMERYPNLIDRAYSCYFRMIVSICSLLKDESYDEIYLNLQKNMRDYMDKVNSNIELSEEFKEKAKKLVTLTRAEYIAEGIGESSYLAL